MASSSVHRFAGAATAGVLAVAVLPAVAAPASAVPVDAVPAAAITEIDAAIVKSRAELVSGGGVQAVTSTFRMGFPVFESDSFGMRLEVDRVRGNLRSLIRMPDLGGAMDGGPLGGISDNVCQPERLSYEKRGETQVVRPGAGTYTAFGSSPGRYVKQGRKLVKRPKARWEKRPGAPATLASAVSRADVSAGLVGYLRDSSVTAATKETLADGVRYRISYSEAAVISDEPGTGLTTVVVDTVGRVTWIYDTVKQEGAESITKVAYTFAPQTVLTPAASTVVERKRVAQGCRAVLTRVVTDEIAREARKWANRSTRPGKKVTVGKVRREARLVLRQDGFSLNIQDDAIADGVLITGRHKLLRKPVVRRVVVVKGKAVVRKGPGADRKRS